MQFWKGQRVFCNGELGTVYQDQELDQTVKVTLDKYRNVVQSVLPQELHLVTSPQDEERIDQFINRQYLP